MEIMHRSLEEFTYRDQEEILDSIIKGLKRLRPHLIYSGFILDSADNYVTDKTRLYAINEETWLKRIDYPSGAAENPFWFANQSQEGVGAVGAYDERQLINLGHSDYYETKNGQSIGKACVRLVLWDK